MLLGPPGAWLKVALLLVSVLCGCGHPSPAIRAAEKSSLQLAPIAQSREADDLGRFIAGLPGKPGSPFAAIEASAAWKEHRRRLDEAWSKTGTELLGGLRQFHDRELSDAEIADSVVFYPFSGPDALMPTACFPHSPLYVMVALEPAGTLPSPAQIRRHKDLPRYLAAMRDSMDSVLSRSFFVTREMDRRFRGQVVDGLLQPILHLLVRTGHTVQGFRYVRLDGEGGIVERPLSWHAPGRIGNKGVDIEFRTDSDGSVHRLLYFSVNLSDSRLLEDKAFRAYAARLQGAVTLFKATSYMLHAPEFSIIREVALARSSAILQDDSGIPYRNFSPELWKVQLYGDYTRPYGSFRWREQPDLRKAYHDSPAKPLPMAVGYGYRKAASNLLLARRVH